MHGSITPTTSWPALRRAKRRHLSLYMLRQQPYPRQARHGGLQRRQLGLLLHHRHVVEYAHQCSGQRRPQPRAGQQRAEETPPHVRVNGGWNVDSLGQHASHGGRVHAEVDRAVARLQGADFRLGRHGAGATELHGGADLVGQLLRRLGGGAARHRVVHRHGAGCEVGGDAHPVEGACAVDRDDRSKVLPRRAQQGVLWVLGPEAARADGATVGEGVGEAHEEDVEHGAVEAVAGCEVLCG